MDNQRNASLSRGTRGPEDRLRWWLGGGTCKVKRRRRTCCGSSNRNAVSICAYSCQNRRSLGGACEGNRAVVGSAPQGASAQSCFKSAVRQRAEERKVAKRPAQLGTCRVRESAFFLISPTMHLFGIYTSPTLPVLVPSAWSHARHWKSRAVRGGLTGSSP